MARQKRKKRNPASEAKPKDFSRASPESEALFPSHLSPIIQCKKSILDRARIEFYVALVAGVIVGILPMSGVTRSVALLLVLGPLVDIIWRSPWSHAWRTAWKASATTLLAGAYLIVASILVVHDYPSLALAITEYLTSSRAEWLIRWLYAIVASATTYVLVKAWRPIRNYMKNSRLEEEAARRKFYDATPKGWLDYRRESEESSARLHFLVARLTRRIIGMGRVMRLFPWLVKKDDKKPPEKRAEIALFFVVLSCEIYTRKIEPEVRDMETTAELFMKSTEGHLKTLSIITKDDFVQLADIHEYFKCQLNDTRELANILAPLPLKLAEVRGHTRESTAALDRLLAVINAQVRVLRRVEGHCARMVRLSDMNFDRALIKVTKPLLTTLLDIIRRMKGEEGIREYRRLLEQHGIDPTLLGLPKARAAVSPRREGA